MAGLIDRIVEIERRLAEQERRNRNRRRTGTIAEADHAKGLYRVKIGQSDDGDYLTGWIRPRQLAAGGVKIDVLLNEGEQVDVVSENGDLTDAMVEMSAYSDKNARENSDTPMHIKIAGDAVIIAAKVRITADVEITGRLDVTGDGVTHNGTNIGDTHRHDGVTSGGSLTGEPA